MADTSHTFHHMLEDAGITQSMSRVAHCIDNGPMEGFWGILKREEYYGSWQKKTCFFIVLLTGSGSKKVSSRVFILCFRCKKTFRTLLTKPLEWGIIINVADKSDGMTRGRAAW